MKMKKKEYMSRSFLGMSKGDSSTAQYVGNKVLPIADATFSTSTTTDHKDHEQCCSTLSEKKDRFKGDQNKTKAMSRMRELLRWAAAAKSEKKLLKVLHFRNRETLKALPDDIEDDQASMESSKISLRWEVESCSTHFSGYSGVSSIGCSLKNINPAAKTLNSSSSCPIRYLDECPRKHGNWITTDSEFVVLEL